MQFGGRLPQFRVDGDAVAADHGIVGTTVAPWQLFFQQSYVVDKRITPRWIGYANRPADRYRRRHVRWGRVDGRHRRRLRRHRGLGHFTDAAGLAAGLQAHAGLIAGAVFAIALLNASIIGAFAVSLSTAYALGDAFGLKHSLHRGVDRPRASPRSWRPGAVAAAVVLIPGAPLGLIIEGVQALAGVLLPSAAVYLLLLCNDTEVLGPWVNAARDQRVHRHGGDPVLVALSVILTASVLDPGLTARQILLIPWPPAPPSRRCSGPDSRPGGCGRAPAWPPR